MRHLLLASVAVLLAAPAIAADLPTKKTPVPVPVVTEYDWTGIYLGAHIGGGMLLDSVSQNGASPSGFSLANTGNLRPAGVIGGLQGGANYEFAPGLSASKAHGATRRLAEIR